MSQAGCGKVKYRVGAAPAQAKSGVEGTVVQGHRLQADSAPSLAVQGSNGRCAQREALQKTEPGKQTQRGLNCGNLCASSLPSQRRIVLMPEMSLIPFKDFEDSAKENGTRHWDAHDLMRKLGYESYASFSKVINKAIASCAQLGIQIHEAFIQTTTLIDGKVTPSYDLTRFACFLVAMHADDKKREVSAAKVYFAAIAASIIERAIADGDLQRLEMRDDIRTGEKILSSTAKQAGINPDGYAFFKDAGIRGMYDMSLKHLLIKKGIPAGGSLYDFAGATELAGNYFRITQTSERIKSKGFRGQRALEAVAVDIGSAVRSTMISNSGVAPENLKISEDLNEVKKRLKTAHRGMKKLDKTSHKAETPLLDQME
jgi:DNA-damage-inducible protein D